ILPLHDTQDGYQQSQDLWLKALETLDGDLKTELIIENIAHVDLPTMLLKIVQDKKQVCLKKRWKYRRSNGEEIVLRDILEKITRWLEKFRAIGDTVATYDPTHAALPWAGVRFIIQVYHTNDYQMGDADAGQVAVNETEIFGSTLLGVETISRLITRYAILEELYLQRTYKGRAELENLLVDLYKESAFHYAEDDQLRNIDINETKVLRFIKLVDTELQLSIAGEVSKRLPGTAKWLLQHPEYNSWMASSSSSILLLHGILGSGKTSLASAVIDYCPQSSSAESLSCLMAYFYCAKGAAEPECSKAEEIIRSILRQLAISREPQHIINEALVTRYERLEAEAKLDGLDMIRMTTKECLDVILEITTFNALVIVVDAVDQIEEKSRYELLFALRELCTRSVSVIKVFLTSRDNQDVFNLLLDARKFRITKDDSREDIELFARHQVTQSITQGKLLRGNPSTELVESLLVALVEGAQEMFQWIKLQIHHLCQFKLESDVRTAMRRLSEKSLSELYAEAYDRIFISNSTARNVALRVCSWLLCMRENLVPEALLLVCQSEHPGLIDVVTLLEVCHNFIIHDSKLNVLRFAHNSIQDFIKGRPDFATLSVNKLVALDCLNFCIAGPQSEMQIAAPGIHDIYQYSVMHWAVHCKAGNPETGDYEIWHKIKEFIFDGPEVSLSFIFWLDGIPDVVESLSRDHPLKKPLSAVPNKQQSPLFTGCAFGLVEVVKQLASHNDICWDQVNDQGQTGLYLAAAAGHENVVHTMLEFPVDINAVGGRYAYPIHAACFSGHSLIVQSLLDSGADPKLRGIFENAFHAALMGGRGDIAVLLLNNSQFKLSNQSEYDAALRQAAQAGFLNVFQTLEGAYKSNFAKSTQSTNRSVLDAVIYKGRQGMLERLLAMKPARDMSLPPDALSKAAFGGHDEMISSLIHQGLDLEAEGPFGTPLRAASLVGHESTVRLLIDRGANVNTDSPLGDPLQAAAMNGHLSVTKILIGEHANVDKVGGFFGNALQAAAYRGQLAVVELLLDARANIYQAGFSKDVFHAAAEGGHENIIRALVKRGHSLQSWLPPARAIRYKRDSPPFDLLRSSSPDHELMKKRGYAPHNRPATRDWPASAYVSDIYGALSIVRDTVKQRAMKPPHAYKSKDHSIHNKEGPNYALEAAALNGHEAVVSSIIEESRKKDQRIDPNNPFRDRLYSVSWGSGLTALENAVTNGHIGIVRLLITSNFEPFANVQQSIKNAAECGYLSIVKMLLAFEDDLNLNESLIQEGGLPSIPHARSSPSRKSKSRHIYDKEKARECSSPEIILLAACRRGHLPVSRYALAIVQERYPIGERHKLLREAICESARHGELATLDMLLESDFQMTPDLLTQMFEDGCKSGHQEVVSLSIDADKNGSLKTSTRQKGLESCVKNGFFELAAFLLQEDSVTHNLSLTEDIIVNASGNGYCEILRLLIEERRRRNLPDLLLDRSLNFACYYGHKDVVEALISFRASIDTIVEVHTNPLDPRFGSIEITNRNALQAALHGSTRFTPYEKYAFLRHEDEFVRADEKCREATLRYIMESGANLNALGGCSDMPLICAIKFCFTEVVALMISRGADFRARRLYKDKEIDVIPASSYSSSDSKSGHEVETQIEEVDTYNAHGDKSAGAMHGAHSSNIALREALNFFNYNGIRLKGRTVEEVLETGPGAVVQLLLGYLPEERAEHENYRLLFQMAAMNGRHELMTLLIDRGIDVNTTGTYYGTALQAAARVGQIETVRMLLDAGADVNVLQGAHCTALRAAVRGGHIDIVELLLNNDANPNLRHKDAKNIMHLALDNAAEFDVKPLPDAGGIADSTDGGDALNSTFPAVDVDLVLARLLLAHGADVNAVAEPTASYSSDADPQNTTLVQIAASQGRHDLVELLIQHGAGIDSASATR
ncbi:MAG: hypothetical protein Q9157_003711, partial [Trypethelium eluteriae]